MTLSCSVVQHGFRATSNYDNWRNLILQGGNYHIDLVQTDASFGGTTGVRGSHPAVFGDARFGPAHRPAGDGCQSRRDRRPICR